MAQSFSAGSLVPGVLYGRTPEPLLGKLWEGHLSNLLFPRQWCVCMCMHVCVCTIVRMGVITANLNSRPQIEISALPWRTWINHSTSLKFPFLPLQRGDWNTSHIAFVWVPEMATKNPAAWWSRASQKGSCLSCTSPRRTFVFPRIVGNICLENEIIKT